MNNRDAFFDSKQPDVKLVGTVQSPYDLAIATARTCYSSKGIITPEEVSANEKARDLRDRIAKSTLEAGHVTTRQHAHFVFALNRVSRSFIWEFLHSHPFYNSEQVSQRYVKVKDGNFTIPELPPHHKAQYKKILNLQMGAYEKLIVLLMPAVSKEYYRIFPNRKKYEGKGDKRWKRVIQKKTYEIARYILPVATQAYLYHTVSALTLLRYYRMSHMPGIPSEQRFVVNRMMEEVLKLDPEFEREIQSFNVSETETEDEIRRVTRDQFSSVKKILGDFDRQLGGKYSKLIDYDQNAISSLAKAVRLVLMKSESELSDVEAVGRALNPAHNPDLGETINVSTLSPLSRTLFHVHFTFLKKISHTADSQNQRHRMTPSTRPYLSRHYFGEPDVIFPKLLGDVPEAKKLFDDVVSQTVETINGFIKDGVSFEKAHYLLPNAWAVRLEESGDLLNWHHKWKLRTCYNAQEEIFHASVDELKQVSQALPSIGQQIMAPCFLRKQAKTTPYCPEGDRYCGVPVWKYSIDQYDRLI